MALPCAATCPMYREGCHKDCPQWKRQVACERRKRLAVKAYLEQSAETTRTIVRQCYALSTFARHHG